MSDSTGGRCHLTYGLIADVQYADTDDGTNFLGTRKRYYRGALDHLNNTVTHWKQSYPDLAFVIQLGDLIDGWNKRQGGNEAAITALETVLKPFRSLSCPTYHETGNHDFYNFTRKQFLGLEPSDCLPQTEQNGHLPEAAARHSGDASNEAGHRTSTSLKEGERTFGPSKQQEETTSTAPNDAQEGACNSSQKPEETTCCSSNGASEGACNLSEKTSKEATCIASEVNSSTLPGVSGIKDELYYSVIVHPQLRVIVLDTYDISTLGFEDWPENPNFKLATAMLEKENPDQENSSMNVHGEAMRFVEPYNGGLGKRQLEWLDSQLTEAEEMKQNVIICGHVQIIPLPRVANCCIWNYGAVFDIIHSHKCVILCLAGHDHDGSITVDSQGIQHLVLNGVLETAPESSAYATAFLHTDRLEVKGSGLVPNVAVPLKYPVESSQ